MKILITGTNGFIGRNLKEYFQDRYTDVYCPKRQELDLVDSSAVSEYLSRHEFDTVIHCAVTLTSVEQNLKMYFNFEKCSRSFGKMLCMGSGAEYDMNHYHPRMNEESFGKHVPGDIYGFSKYVIAKDIESSPGNIINLRLFGIYGKYEDYKRRFISNNICRALCCIGLSINKNMFFDYLFVDDFSRIVELFITRDTRRRSYNICTGGCIDLLTLAKIIQEVDGKNLPIAIKEEGFKPEYSGDNTLFLEEFGQFSFTPHVKAVSELYRWYRDSSTITLHEKDFI
jgi:UDP-glucose 4-epimerase